MMHYRKRYITGGGDSNPSSTPDKNPLKVPEGYWEEFDELLFRKISWRKKVRRIQWASATAVAAAFIAGLFFYKGMIGEDVKVEDNRPEVSSTQSVPLTGSHFTDQLLADEIIEMAANTDTVLLDVKAVWGKKSMKDIPDETITEFLLMEGVSSTEIELAINH